MLDSRALDPLPKDVMEASARRTHAQAQREYYEGVERPRLTVADTPFVRRHVEEIVAAGRLAGCTTLLEVGAGLGRFTLPLLKLGFDVTANDVSPALLARLESAAPRAVPTVACDVAEIDGHVQGSFDAVVGFFMLHHLLDLEGTFRALARVVRPGGRVAFCEPVAWNPLYYVQVALTPHMTFRGEPSLLAMRPGRILPALESSGFVDARARSYGYFPPFLKNTRAGDRLERWLECRAWVPWPHAFQVFSGRRPE